jgi:far upstream element-binding protein
LLTPYGPPSPFAHIIPVPNECVGLIIGRGGETIRQLQVESGAKIQVAKREVLNTNMRNVFIEGPPEKYEKARKLIEDVVEEHKKIHNTLSIRKEDSSYSGPVVTVGVPNNLVGLIIGHGGDTIRMIQDRTETNIYVPRESRSKTTNETLIEITGKLSNSERAKKEILSIVRSVDCSNYSYENSSKSENSRFRLKVNGDQKEPETVIENHAEDTNEASII